MSDKPKKWTWEEWEEKYFCESFEYIVAEDRSIDSKVKIAERAFHARDAEIEWLESENKKFKAKIRAMEINRSLRSYDGVVEEYESRIKELETENEEAWEFAEKQRERIKELEARIKELEEWIEVIAPQGQKTCRRKQQETIANKDKRIENLLECVKAYNDIDSWDVKSNLWLEAREALAKDKELRDE